MAPSNPNQKPLGSKGSKDKSPTTNVDNSSTTLPLRPAMSNPNLSDTTATTMPNPPRSTVARSRFFPGGRPVPDLVLRGYGPNQGQQGQAAAQATGQTTTSQEGLAQGQGQGTARSENTPSNFTPTNARNASQPRRVERRDELEHKAPTAEAQKRLQPTRPGDTWVTGLQSWRRGGAPQQRPPQGFDAKASSSFLRDEQRRSTLSPFAPAFRSYAPGHMATAPAVVTPAPALPLPLPLPRAPAPAPAPPRGANSRPQGFRHTAGQRQQNQGFRPMNSKLDPEAKNRPLTKEEVEYRKALGISPNYRGEATNPQNISADIPDHENCSLWLTNLPPHCSYRDLLAAVARHQPGRIYATSISPPDAESDHTLPSHRTSAAKMAFYRPEEATRLLQLCSMGLLKVQGYRVRAVRNRVKVPANLGKDNTSRCLVIWGPRALVNEIQLTRLFNTYFSFDTEEVILRHEGENFRCLEWRFGSFRAQAESAQKMLNDKEHKDFYTVEFARDPCERTFG
ncbi:hypothetical protein VSDG_05308 [Cytospora chrysosperma]|uniref:Uncharacterized protein n=1 Tax=Cytospora chrysosperma TaxID=252740 RepID=A0A423VX18_CYTCH|nr:hypothetical protein VSDG_05308 [Valsa sordida]